MQLFQSLTERFASVVDETRLGVRLVLRRWRQVDAKKRGRVELAAVLSLLPLSAAIGAFAVAPVVLEPDESQQRSVTQALALPSLQQQIGQLSQAESFIREAKIQRGETITALLERMGVDDPVAANYLRLEPDARPLAKLRSLFVQASVREEGRLNWLRFFAAGDADAASERNRLWTLERVEGTEKFSLTQSEVALERRTEMKSGEISSTFYSATDTAGVPDLIAQQIIDALEGQVDFHRDLRGGDSFRVIYEALYASGEYLRPGRLLAVEFVNKGRAVQAFWFADGSKAGGFFAADGRSMKRAFLRSPLEFTRITSGFDPHREHPLFGYTAAHRGVDYASPSGAKVRTIGEGSVQFAGWMRGYGNMVEIRHDAKRSTVYAHLSAFAPGLRVGARVGQGELIGFVGATGWATGPHLHFELKENGAQVNPLLAQLPDARPLATSQLPALRVASEPLQQQLDLLARVQTAQSAGQ